MWPHKQQLPQGSNWIDPAEQQYIQEWQQYQQQYQYQDQPVQPPNNKTDQPVQPQQHVQLVQSPNNKPVQPVQPTFSQNMQPQKSNYGGWLPTIQAADTGTQESQKRPRKTTADWKDIKMAKRAKKIPVPAIKCDLCQMTMSSQLVYEYHLAGKVHKKKMNLLNDPPKRCELCDLTLKNRKTYDDHIGGHKHLKKALVDENAAKWREAKVAKKAIDSEKLQRKQEKNPEEPKEPEVICCEVCDVTVNSQQQLELHMNGLKHKYTVANKGSEGSEKQLTKKEIIRGMKQQKHEAIAKMKADKCAQQQPVPVEIVAKTAFAQAVKSTPAAIKWKRNPEKLCPLSDTFVTGQALQ